MYNKLYGVSGGIGCGKDEVTRILIEIASEDNINFVNVKYAFELKRLVSFILGVDVSILEDRVFKNTPIPDMEITQIVYKSIRNSLDVKTINTFSSIFEHDVIEVYMESGYEYSGIRTIEVTPRWLMQNIGTNCFREIISKDFWVWKTFKNFNETSNWVISDVRYPKNEGLIINNNNGIIIGVKRRFDLRYPEFSHLMDPLDPYKIPLSLKDENRDLYLELTSDSELSTHDLSWCDEIIENNSSLDDLKNKVKEIYVRYS